LSITHDPPKATNADTIYRVINSKDVSVVYQPLVDLHTRTVFAYEALARARREDFSSPLDLINAAVEHDCLGELGRVIRSIAIQGCPSYPLFLNIHPAELNERWLVQPDDPIFQHTEDVYLEITESVPLSHFRLCQSILKEVRGRGVYLVVDDLGAGFSNLKYIADLHPKFVKLDRNLIAGLASDQRLFKLVSAIVALCKDLGASVVAEGIETLHELDAARKAGAHLGQGYALARPSFPPPRVTWPPPPHAPPPPRTPTRARPR